MKGSRVYLADSLAADLGPAAAKNLWFHTGASRPVGDRTVGEGGPFTKCREEREVIVRAGGKQDKLSAYEGSMLRGAPVPHRLVPRWSVRQRRPQGPVVGGTENNDLRRGPRAEAGG